MFVQPNLYNFSERVLFPQPIKICFVCFCFLASQRTATACNYVTSSTNIYVSIRGEIKAELLVVTSQTDYPLSCSVTQC